MYAQALYSLAFDKNSSVCGKGYCLKLMEKAVNGNQYASSHTCRLKRIKNHKVAEPN